MKSHELSRKGHPNHNASLSSKALITSTRVDGYDANTIHITVSSALKFALSSLTVASNEQYKSIPDYEITVTSRVIKIIIKSLKL
jgi:hypothetical protein